MRAHRRLALWARPGWVALWALPMLLGSASARDADWGTPARPFSAQSPWNARPVRPVLGDFEIPRSTYQPAVSEGKYSTGVFVAGPRDRPERIHPAEGQRGVWDPDAEQHRTFIDLPRWPAGVLPASGSDGHAEVVDAVAGIVHSFWKLRAVGDRWTAAQYAWTRLDGRGWGDPAHYFQGARAAAVPTMGGLIRTAEIDDGRPLYRHALAMSLTYDALSPDPTYVYPATSADSDAARRNTGKIPEGALLMLPPEFDTQALSDDRVRKVAETLKVHGAYVVDRNVGTPFVIYVENGSGFALHRPRWNNAVARDLDSIRAALRQVVDVAGWVDGDGQPMQPTRHFNLLSMRGPWRLAGGGDAPGGFDTWQQALVFPPGPSVTQSSSSPNNVSRVAWARPTAGQRLRLTAVAVGGGTLRLTLVDAAGGASRFDSGPLAHGEHVDFEWPDGAVRTTLTVRSAGVDRPTTVSGRLDAVGEDASGAAR